MKFSFCQGEFSNTYLTTRDTANFIQNFTRICLIIGKSTVYSIMFALITQVPEACYVFSYTHLLNSQSCLKLFKVLVCVRVANVFVWKVEVTVKPVSVQLRQHPARIMYTFWNSEIYVIVRASTEIVVTLLSLCVVYVCIVNQIQMKVTKGFINGRGSDWLVHSIVRISLCEHTGTKLIRRIGRYAEDYWIFHDESPASMNT